MVSSNLVMSDRRVPRSARWKRLICGPVVFQSAQFSRSGPMHSTVCS